MAETSAQPASTEPAEAAELPAASDTDLADRFRTQSFHIMEAHPIAAAHLVLAAASIAPTCAAEQEVADECTYVIADFAQQLRIIHHRSVCRRDQEARSTMHGHR